MTISIKAICTGGIRINANENQSWNLPHEKYNVFYEKSAYRDSVLAQFLAGN